jgi:hypothetical protein
MILPIIAKVMAKLINNWDEGKGRFMENKLEYTGI